MPNQRTQTKQFDVDVSTAMSASPSAQFPGGVVYTFPDGSFADVHGGDSMSYRANSPGFHGSPADATKYGAIGVAKSREPEPGKKEPASVLVFKTKEAAEAGLAQKLNEIDSSFTKRTRLSPIFSTDITEAGDPAMRATSSTYSAIAPLRLKQTIAR